MTDLIHMYDYLNQVIQHDSLLCLAQVVCWLAPLWRGYDEDYYHDPDGILSTALVVTRQLFPDLYVDAVDKLRQGADYAAIDHLISDGISETGIPLDNLEHIIYGIPLPAYGVNLNDPEFYAGHPKVLPLLALFGIELLPNRYNIDVPACVFTAAELIATDLGQRSEKEYQQVAWLLGWLFSATGNSILDWDFETMCEIEPLVWEADALDFAYVMIHEADDIMSEVIAAIDWLNDSPEIMQAIQANIHRIYNAIQEKGSNNDASNVELKWLELGFV